VFLRSDDLRKAVIRGIFDTDGGIQLMKKNNKLYPVVYIGTISKGLNYQLLFLLNELGLRTATNNYLPQKGNRLRVYRTVISGVEMFDNFMEIIKPANPKHVSKYNSFKETFK